MNKNDILHEKEALLSDGEKLTLKAIITLSDEKGQIILIKGAKKEIAMETGLKVNTVTLYIYTLKKMGILKNIDRGIYSL